MQKLGYKLLSSNTRKLIKQRCNDLNVLDVFEHKFESKPNLDSMTKKEIFDSHKNWQSSRNMIRKNASKRF